MTVSWQRSWLASTWAWTTGSLVLAVLQHVPLLPAWISAAFALLVLWRVWLELRPAPLPSRGLRLACLITLVLAVFASFRTLNGLDAGTALLALMAGLKLLEMRNPRDHVVVLLICFFLVLASFLQAQRWWLLPMHATVVWMTTTALLRVTQGPASLTPLASARYAGRLLLQAAPLMILLFLFFPRIPGPFWALPSAGRGISGLSDTMSPGDLSELSLSSDPAFRVRFHGAVPPPAARYWRGPVLHDFDGYTWSRVPARALLGSSVTFTGTAYDYSLMLEGSRRDWVFALDLPESWAQSQIRQLADFQLVARSPLRQPRTFEMRSRTGYRAGEELSRTLRAADTRLPAERNPRTLELAQRLRARSAGAEDYIRTVLDRFRNEGFEYTLIPPGLDEDSVDDFLFNTRRGFCGHFASAFTTLMRAAGIPARVVTGYQGGELNPWANYYLVRQSDAHAWSEVWLERRGWVRVDPTAVIAPERIERGLIGAVAASEPVPGRLLRQLPWLADLRFAWDALDTAWRERIVEFGVDTQADLLEGMGLSGRDWRTLTALLVASLVIAMALVLWELRRELSRGGGSPVDRAYRTFCRRLERCGLRRLPHEGPRDFAARVRGTRPDLGAAVEAISRLYRALRYEAACDPQSLAELQRRVRELRVARPTPERRNLSEQ